VSEVTVPQLAEYLGMTPRTIISNIKKGKYPTAHRVSGNGTGRGGWIWKIHVSDLPPGIKAKYYEKHLNDKDSDPTADGDKALTKTEPSAPLSLPHLLSAPQEQSINCPAHGGHLGQGRGSHSPVPVTFSEKSQKIALARMDLIRVWKDYRKDHRKVTDADKEFIDIYNSGLIYKNLYDVLGGKATKTLYTWNKELAGTTDWTRLIPLNYEKHEGLNEVEKKTFLGILLNPKKFRIGTAITMTKVCLKNKGIPSDKSDRTFRRFTERYKAEHYDSWVLAREGQKALKDEVAPFIRRDPSLLEVGDVLVADGHRLNFQTINPFTGKPCRAVLVGYLDWKSYNLAGYEIMLEEGVQNILSALRSSIIQLGKIPKIAYQDNGKAFRARFFTSIENFEEAGFYGLFGRLGIVPVFAQPYNSRSKIIERWFKEFSNTCERLIPSFTGASIQDKPAWMLRNEKLHKVLHKEYVPTIEEAIQIIDSWLEWQRSQPCPHVKDKTIGQVFNEGRGPGIDINQLDILMLAIDKKRIGRNGIKFLHSDYYDESLYGLRENVLIRYCFFDLSYIKVYRMNGQFLCIAKRLPSLHPMANHLGTPKDMEDLKQRLSEHRKLEKKTTQGVRGLMKMGRPIQLGWEKVIDAAPMIVDKLEKDNAISPAGLQVFGHHAKKKDMPIEIDRSIIEKSIPFIEFLKRLVQEVGPISKELNQKLRAEYGDSIKISKAEEIIQQQLGNLPEPENPENHSPVFQYGWQRYEFLNNKQSLTEEEKQWIKDYKEGRILPGEYEEIYIKSRQQNVSENNQCPVKREAL